MVHIVFASVLSTITFLATTVISRKTTNPSKIPKNAVLLSKVASLTLRDGKLTSSRRVDPVPQLECVGPEDVCRLYKVDTMRCTNEGADYNDEDIQWSCKASLPEEFKLGSTDVVCEGYESSDDPYILKGSCGVEYRLLLTEKGETKFGSGYQQKPEHGNYNNRPNALKVDFGRQDSTSKIPGFVFAAIFIVVLVIILRGIWSRARGNPPRLGGGFGPYGGGDDNDPPPPYDNSFSYGSPPTKKTTTRSTTTRGSSNQSRASSSRTAGTQRQDRSWRPGFWTGALTGAGAAYAANRMAGNRTQTEQRRQDQQPAMQQRQPSMPATAFSQPSFSSERQESTGFGGTRRR